MESHYCHLGNCSERSIDRRRFVNPYPAVLQRRPEEAGSVVILRTKQCRSLLHNCIPLVNIFFANYCLSG